MLEVGPAAIIVMLLLLDEVELIVVELGRLELELELELEEAMTESVVGGMEEVDVVVDEVSAPSTWTGCC